MQKIGIENIVMQIHQLQQQPQAEAVPQVEAHQAQQEHQAEAVVQEKVHQAQQEQVQVRALLLKKKVSGNR